MKVKKYIGKSVNGYTILDTYVVKLSSGAITRKVLLKCDNCGREFERNSGVNFSHIKCKCKCDYLKPKKSHYNYIEYNGEKLTQTEFCKKYNIAIGTFRSRLSKGMSIEEAIQKNFVCVCEICHNEFISDRPNKKYCCKTCENRGVHGKGEYKTPKIFICAVCGKEFESLNKNAKTCSKECNSDLARIERNKRYNYLKQQGHFDKSVTLKNVFNKFNGKCQICEKQLNFECNCLSDDYPSIDHIIPLSKGGFHEWNNVQLLCRKCNCTKSNKINFSK